jgi:hypothetical protein
MQARVGDGLDLTGTGLLNSKALLERLLKRMPASSPLRYSEQRRKQRDDAQACLPHGARGHRLEGPFR